MTGSNASASGSRQNGKQPQPFSLFARPSKASPISNGSVLKDDGKGKEGDEEMVLDGDGEDETVNAGPGHARTRSASGSVNAEGEDTRMQSVSRSREERLRHDLFVMRKLNDAFSLYIDSLSSAQSATEVRSITY